MAAHSNRSPSPIAASRPINPNLRNSENNSGIRRSFSTKPSILTNSRRFEPTTPANSPSDFPRRNSVDSHPKEKENFEKDQNLKSPKFQPSAKGPKNFMTPTISAASKFSPSPKKKVLVERNDPVRTSMSLSEGKALFFSTNMSEELEWEPEIGHHKTQRTESSLDFNDANLEKKQAVPEDLRVSKSLKRVTFSVVPSDSHSEFLPESVITESDSSKSDSCLNNEISCSPNPSTIAPLDADPSLPPYDPKTNYLSPRPQFLHYKPNPRVEILLNKEKGLEGDELRRLEDNLMAEILSESFSDSERSDDSQNEDPLKEEFCCMVSADMVVGIEDEMEDIPHASEPAESLESGTSLPDAVSEVNSIKEKQKKPWSVSRLFCFAVILMFLLACGSVFVFNSPAFDEVALNELRFSNVRKMYHQSRVAASVARHVEQFSVNYVSFISNLASGLGRGENNIGTLQFMNLSNPQNSGQNQGEFLLNKERNEELMEEDLEEDDDNFEEDANVENGVDSDEKEFGAEEVVLEGSEGGDVELEEVVDAEMNIYEEEEEEAYSGVGFDDSLVKEYGTGDDALDAENVRPDCLNLVETESANSENIESQGIVDNETEQLGVASQEDRGSEVEVASDRAEPEAEAVQASQEDDRGSEVEVASDRAEEDRGSEVEVASDRAEAEAEAVQTSQEDHGSEVEVASDRAEPEAEAFQTSLATGSLSSEDNMFPVHYAAGLSTLIASLFAAAAYIYHHKRNLRRAANIVQENPSKLGHKQTSQNGKSYSQNWQQMEVGETETCPSEMSSSRNNSAASSYSKKETRGASEAQSTERKTTTRKHYSKREQQPRLMTTTTTTTTISSSEYTTGSPSSYGSFTSFERIPIKNANADDEVITPVRRSSRLRNHHHQAVSP